MTVHLLKLCVGIEDVDQLVNSQAARLDAMREAGDNKPKLRHITRNMPRRAREVLDGGSLYWVIRRVIQVRQKIIGLEPMEREDGRSACAIILGPELIRIRPRSFRPFQGWRYFPDGDVPPDLPPGFESGSSLPTGMAEELRILGLI